MAMRLLLRCGCEIAYRENDHLCPAHGKQQIVRALGVPPPRIVGVATGPHVIPRDLPPWRGQIVGSEKESGS